MKSRVASIVAFALLLGAAAVLYATDLSGIPDDGPVPVPMLPAFLFHVETTAAVRTCWLLACAAYVLPPLITALRSAPDGLISVALLISGSWLLLPTPEPMHEDYVPSFTRTAMVEGLLWLVALTAAGFGLGSLIKRVGRSGSGSRQDRST